MDGSGREALRDGGLGAAGGAVVVARGERAGRGRGAGALRVRTRGHAETERLRRTAVVTGH